jgi:dUTP pyrophosphatase
MSILLQVPIKKFPHSYSLALPSYATLGSAGLDLLAAVESNIILEPWKRTLIPTGIAIALPRGYEAQIRPRSGLALKNGITLINTPGTIDSDYRGEIFLPLVNFGDTPFTIERGLRIAQMIITSYSVVEWNLVEDLETSDRNSGGFGSTGLL